MPSPFPGMDPFLEDPGLWPDVHTNLITELQAVLNRLIRPNYRAHVEERLYVSTDLDPGRAVIVPDVSVRRERPSSPGSVGVAPTEVQEPIIATTLIDEEIHEPYIEIVDRHGHDVITCIEILSPTNKYPGSEGMANYRKKRQQLLHSTSHLVEIDLLRAGKRMGVGGVLPEHDYLIHVSRREERPDGRLWPVRLTQPLPTIAVPLKDPDERADVPLQDVLNSAYDRAAYDIAIDYGLEPDPPLTPEQTRWADELLRAKGLR